MQTTPYIINIIAHLFPEKEEEVLQILNEICTYLNQSIIKTLEFQGLFLKWSG